ncbi:hypothetical protein D1007_12192 [Hordeum vulgare]|nr:hypothetical protein D1007_12192 [Hordeum vulgare]
MAAETSGSRANRVEDPSVLLDNLVWEDEAEDPDEKSKWLALARFNCLADWNKALHQGPWDFKGMALTIAKHDGFKNPESVKLDNIETWCQIHRLPNMVLKREQFVINMVQRIGEVMEVQIVLPNGFIGEFIRVRVKIDVSKKLTRFVGFTKAGVTEYYQVKFEKPPVFCFMCGLRGHWHEECVSGEHDKKDMECGSFILASLRGADGSRNSVRGTGRGSGRGSGTGDDDDEAATAERRGGPAGTRGHGRGKVRGFQARDPQINTTDAKHLHTSWRFNGTNAQFDLGAGGSLTWLVPHRRCGMMH